MYDQEDPYTPVHSPVLGMRVSEGLNLFKY